MVFNVSGISPQKCVELKQMRGQFQYPEFVLEVMNMVITLIVVMVTQVYMYISQLEVTKSHTLIICPFLYTSFTSIELGGKGLIQYFLKKVYEETDKGKTKRIRHA